MKLYVCILKSYVLSEVLCMYRKICVMLDGVYLS